MSGLTDLTLTAARDGLRARRFSASELARAHIAAIERRRALNAFITETPEQALAMAAEADARLAKGEGGLLEGVPLAIKDLFCTEGVLTTAAAEPPELPPGTSAAFSPGRVQGLRTPPW